VTLQLRILAGVLLGLVVGALARVAGAEMLRSVVIALEPLGTAFIRLVTMVVVPLVVASLFVGVASLGDVQRLGKIGGRTLLTFLATTLAAAVIGLSLAVAAHLGTGLEAGTRDALVSHGATAVLAPPPDLVTTLLAMVPQNPFASAAQGDLLPLIVAVCIFGAAATVVKGDGVRSVTSFFSGVNDLSMTVIRWLMYLAPGAVFILLAATVARTGVDLLGSLLEFSVVVVLALAVHTVVVLVPLLRFAARMNVAMFFRSVSDALLLAFSTASSSATLPVSMAAARDRLGLPAGVVSFVLPAGATLNKNGAAVYKAVTAVYVAHLYGVVLAPSVMLTIVLVSTVAAFAGAGVPGSSLVTTLIVLNAIGLGPHASAGIALVVAVDRPLDMCRSAVNTIGNLVTAAVVARGDEAAVA
jgi:Na+/H+-dicarboxylate symporter